MKRLMAELSVAIAEKKFAKAAKAAVRMFVDFIDPRHIGAAVYAAGHANRLEAMRLLHEMRADLDKPNTAQGATPASIASQEGHAAMLQLLYGLGADVHRARPDGLRPIQFAALDGHDKPVLLLLSLRAAVNAQSNRGVTACWTAAAKGHIRVVTTLLHMRADPNLAVAGCSAADMARVGGHDELLALLISNGGLHNIRR